jgi:hypothetical protein
VGELIELSGDAARDMARLRAAYAEKRGIVPENTSEVRLRSGPDHE